MCRRTRLENVFTITIRAFDPGFRAHAQINHRMAHGGVAASIAADGGIIGFNCFRRFIDYGVIHFLNKSFLAARTNRGTGFVVREAGVPNMFRTIFQTSVGDDPAALKMLHVDDTRCSLTINRRAMAQAPSRINPPPRPLPDLAIKTRGLGKTYGGCKVAEALRGIYLDIPRGAIVSLLGPKGAGNSILINILAGLVIKSRARWELEILTLTAMAVRRAAPLAWCPRRSIATAFSRRVNCWNSRPACMACHQGSGARTKSSPLSIGQDWVLPT